VPLRRYDELERTHQVRGDGQPYPPLVDRLANPAEIQVLQVANPAVDDLQGIVRRARTEIRLFDERHRQAAQRRVTSYTGAVDPAANDQDIEAAIRERVEVALHESLRGLPCYLCA